MLKIKNILLYILFLNILFSCKLDYKNIINKVLITKKNKKQAYFFYNSEYYSIYEKKYTIYNLIKKKLSRNFYNINQIQLKALSDLPAKLKEIKLKDNESIIFLDSTLSVFLIKNKIFPKKSKIKLLTYDLTYEDMDEDPKIPVFNINIDMELLYKKIIGLLKEKSKKIEDLSDCGIILDKNYYIGRQFLDYIEKNNLKIDVLEIKNETNIMSIKDWINDKKKDTIVFFAFDNNRYLMDLEQNELNNTTFIEVFTDYGEVSNIIRYKIDINWELVVIYAMESKEFDSFIGFINNKTDDSIIESTQYNHILNNDNLIFVKKYSHRKTLDEINDEIKKIEEKTKKNSN